MIGFLPHIIAAAEEPQGISALGIDPWALLAQAVTFLILFWVIKRFALDKIVNTLEDRRKTINKGVLLGMKMEKEKEALDEKVEQLLHEARLESDKIIAGGHREAGEIIKAAEEAATRKASALIEDAHNRIDEDIQRAKNELRSEMVHLVADTTEAVIGEKIDSKKDRELVERLLKEVT